MYYNNVTTKYYGFCANCNATHLKNNWSTVHLELYYYLNARNQFLHLELKYCKCNAAEWSAVCISTIYISTIHAKVEMLSGRVDECMCMCVDK